MVLTLIVVFSFLTGALFAYLATWLTSQKGNTLADIAKSSKLAGAEAITPISASWLTERTNSLVVLASPLAMRQIKDLVQRLDIHSPNETSRIHVYHLKYAPAGEMVGRI
jgi:hypothetical protein